MISLVGFSPVHENVFQKASPGIRQGKIKHSEKKECETGISADILRHKHIKQQHGYHVKYMDQAFSQFRLMTALQNSFITFIKKYNKNIQGNQSH